MSDNIYKEIELDLALLNKLFKTFKPEVEKYRQQEPTAFEMGALGSILHTFYNGIENISIRIASRYDGNPQRSDVWHIELLEMMMKSKEERPAVISQELKTRLRNYLSFRHVFRHIYGFDLQWQKMKDTLLTSEETLRLLEHELRIFMEKLRSRNPE